MRLLPRNERRLAAALALLPAIAAACGGGGSQPDKPKPAQKLEVTVGNPYCNTIMPNGSVKKISRAACPGMLR